MKLARAWCEQRGLAGLQVEVHELPGRTPVLLLELPGDGDSQDSVLLYGHLDKQPEMNGWRQGLAPFSPVLEGDKLLLIPRRWTVLGLGLPAWLFPRIEAWEAEEDGRFRFHVDISHPLTGQIVLYRGWLELKAT